MPCGRGTLEIVVRMFGQKNRGERKRLPVAGPIAPVAARLSQSDVGGRDLETVTLPAARLRVLRSVEPGLSPRATWEKLRDTQNGENRRHRLSHTTTGCGVPVSASPDSEKERRPNRSERRKTLESPMKTVFSCFRFE